MLRCYKSCLRSTVVYLLSYSTRTANLMADVCNALTPQRIPISSSVCTLLKRNVTKDMLLLTVRCQMSRTVRCTIGCRSLNSLLQLNGTSCGTYTEWVPPHFACYFLTEAEMLCIKKLYALSLLRLEIPLSSIPSHPESSLKLYIQYHP